MQRTFFILAYFFILAAVAAQQYPFVHYTPKDGLISNEVKYSWQKKNSKG
jgi:hypothetical protein